MTQAAQTLQVLSLLKKRKSKGLTPLEALREVGSLRLGARIYDLRQEGHDIQTEWETSDDKRYARYVLVRAA